ncbi:baseplate J/gp47 family protein [Acetobacter sacchari]|uniref:Baseplate J/gp47 family protein n=1 Tax=Acetobacter sacchari TaxID=2661687 RepID=A0ABS3M0M6_9PROT|nr:baseplate J/gp47 family protein [Acetobacter sacchari]MBO1361755.1 baseplate J/gp47 family protein [Acetobacter sacchari]
MSLTLRSFTTTVSTAITAAQGACASLLDMTVGTVGRALMEAVAGVGLWLQYVALQILTRVYLTTSTGSDIDTWVEQFGMTREAGTAATTNVMMTSFSPSGQSATVAVGDTVKTVSGIIFTVTKDTSNSAWSTAAAAYVRAAGTAAITVPVQCTTTGTTGNVAAGAICLLGTAISGIDIVTNVTAVVNGSDGETDAALIARFPNWLAAKATACEAAIESAIAGVQTNLTDAIMDGQAADGTTRAGYFTAVVDDGTGDPSDTLIEDVYTAIDAVRACGVGFATIGPVETVANVSMTVTVPSGTATAAVETTVQTAITSDIDAQSVGAGYAYSRLSVVAWNNATVTPTSITDVLLNGAQADLPASSTGVIRAGTVSITVVAA